MGKKKSGYRCRNKSGQFVKCRKGSKKYRIVFNKKSGGKKKSGKATKKSGGAKKKSGGAKKKSSSRKPVKPSERCLCRAKGSGKQCKLKAVGTTHKCRNHQGDPIAFQFMPNLGARGKFQEIDTTPAAVAAAATAATTVTTTPVPAWLQVPGVTPGVWQPTTPAATITPTTSGPSPLGQVQLNELMVFLKETGKGDAAGTVMASITKEASAQGGTQQAYDKAIVQKENEVMNKYVRKTFQNNDPLINRFKSYLNAKAVQGNKLKPAYIKSQAEQVNTMMTQGFSVDIAMQA